MENEEEINYDKVIYVAEMNLLERSIDIDDITTSITIGLFGSGLTARNYFQDPYFKVAEGKHKANSKKIARIKIFRAEYDVHNNEKWTMNDAEKDLLIKTLQTVTKSGMTVWEMVTYEAGIFASGDPRCTQADIAKINNAVMPDYTDLHYVIKGQKKYNL